MAQITVRADVELIERVRLMAEASGRSMNEFVVVVLDAPSDPSLAGTEAEQLRERLRHAGLLATWPRRPGVRPPKAQLHAGGGRAARGTSLAQHVSDGR